ncbi:CDP-alcohol phosphatidyltransferase family protein [Balneola sp. MJW-20]|uniref:CDP-alcohol phosphatidyltransferase family protein n=1 Tax=Gracilimonas aurantiaca TaxID=3234185 RepID=UPI00390AAB37
MSTHTNIDGKKVQVSGKVMTWSNVISVSRVLIAFPVIYLHYTNGQQVTPVIWALIIYGVLSDYLDGLVARKTNSISEFGKMMDPISDKLSATALFIYTVWLGWIPLWFLIFSIVRDGLIMAGSFYIRRKYHKVAMSIMSGKVSVNVMALYWLSVFFFQDASSVHMFLLSCSVVIMLFSLFDYFNRYRMIMKGAEFN